MTEETTTPSSPANLAVGSQLRAAREALGLTWRELAAVTKIQAHFLECLENEAWDEFPAEVFARGFLRSYARELRLDEDRILEAYAQQTGRAAKRVVPASATSIPAPVAPGEATETPRIARVAYGALVALLVVLLAGAVLVFGSSTDDAPSTATYAPEMNTDGWRPAPEGVDDWRTLREN